jgi:hypothetical protein
MAMRTPRSRARAAARHTSVGTVPDAPTSVPSTSMQTSSIVRLARSLTHHGPHFGQRASIAPEAGASVG